MKMWGRNIFSHSKINKPTEAHPLPMFRLQTDLQFHAHLDNIMLRWVVLVAVGEHEAHISCEAVGVPVLPPVQLFLRGGGGREEKRGEGREKRGEWRERKK